MPLPVRRARRARRRRRRAASSCVPLRHRCPEHREVWIESERAPEPAFRLRGVAEAALDHAAVKELGCIARTEPERTLRVAERLLTAPRPGERPSEHVVSVDARAIAVRSARETKCLPRAHTMVDVEQRSLEICLDTI